MRKTFLTFCAAALALLAVSSCGKLEDGLNSLKGELADLKDRVEKLESKLNSEVSALQQTMATLATKQEMNSALATLKTSLEAKDAELASSIQSAAATLAGLDAKYVGKSTYEAALAELNNKNSALQTQLNSLAALLGETSVAEVKAELLAKIAEAVAAVTVTVVEDQNGSVVITLANGQSFTVAKDANVNNTGLVTVDEDGNWCVILEDGSLRSLDAKVGVEELEFSVDYDTKELLYSVNGGAFQGTGAYVSDWDATVVTDFYEDDNFVYITVGGVEYTLVKATSTSASILAGKTYFTASETKVIPFQTTDVKSAFVAAAPKGWEVELNFAEKTLTVTAPAEGEGVASGAIEVWLLGNDGVVVSKTLAVAVGEAVIAISVDPKTNFVTMVFNQVEGEEGEMETPEVIYGATLASEFTDEYVEDLLSNLLYAEYMGAFSNNDPMNPDNAANRATGFEGMVSELVGQADYNAEYVVWAIQPVWQQVGYQYASANTANDFVKVYHQMNAVNVESVAELTDANVSVQFLDENVKGFYGFYFNQWTLDYLSYFEEGYLSLSDLFSGMFGTEIPCLYYEGRTLEVKLSEFGWSEEYLEWEMYNMITPLSTSTICFVPVYEGKEEYAYSDVVIRKVSTKEIVAGGAMEYTEETEVDYTSFTVNVEAADAVYAMYKTYNVANGNYPETDEEVLAEVADYYTVEEFEYGAYEGECAIVCNASYGENPGTEYVFVLVLIGEDGKATIVRKEVATVALPVNESLSVAVDAYIDEITGRSKAVFTITGDAAKMYFVSNSSMADYMDVASCQIAILNGNTNDWIEVDLTDVEGEYVAEDYKVAANSYRDTNNYVHVILVDSEGKVSGLFTSEKYVVAKGYTNN